MSERDGGLCFGRWYPLVLVLWLGALTAYIMAGVPLVSFHGDEGMLIYATRDVLDEAASGDVLALTTTPPYPIDSRAHLRIINGSVQRYAFGAVLLVRGHNVGDLQQEPGWNWGLSYDDNVEGGWLPKDSILTASRYTSAAFFALSLIPLVGIAHLLSGRVAALASTALVALNPLLLLNGRRAVQEGVMLCFGLLVMWVAVWLAKRVRAGERAPAIVWWGLAIAGGLALASKHSAALFLMAAWLWIGLAMLAAPRHRARTLADLIFSGVGAIAVFVMLSPALWNNPPARLLDLTRLRGELLSIQVDIEEGAPTSVEQRARWMLSVPYTAPVTHYERAEWGEVAAIASEEAAYESSVWRGYPTSVALGVALTGLAVLGLIALTVRQPIMGAGMLVWYAVTGAIMLVNPLPWERYYIPLVPVVALLTACGVAVLLRPICEQTRTETPLQAPDSSQTL
jgi:hypothetical protein